MVASFRDGGQVPEMSTEHNNSTLPLFKILLPKVPLIAKTALYHTLGYSEHAKHWTLRTDITVNVLRSLAAGGRPQPISKTQHVVNKDPGVKGRIWISRVKFPAPQEDNIRQELFKSIEALKGPEDAAGGYKEPELLSVEAEWTGYRAGATKTSAELRIPEAQKYTEMMREVSSPVTVLYFHGGAYYLCDPSTHRPTTKKLAKITKGRVLSVRYRLAPQNPFPAALLDALVCYFNLLHPPPGSFHNPVDPRHIVFGGDSAGGNLCLVLLQTLLQFRRQGLKLRWNGQELEVPLPAGVSLNSAWADITHSSPSCESNENYDYIPPPTVQAETMEFPPCPVWPADPPRNHLYAEDALLCHPLVSPLAAKSWAGSCPMYIECGQELLTDENKHLAATVASQGVTLVFEEYETMPHCFAMVLGPLPEGKRCFYGWTQFITNVVERPEVVKTLGLKIMAKTLKETPIDMTKLSTYTEDEVLNRMRERVASFKNSVRLSKL